MKFSVLIPVYNTEKYLEECLDSVFNQTHRDFEIVLVDDGSKDRSGEICDRYQSEYPDKIKVIHQENSGQLVSRIKAAQIATGDYCIFMDADDLIVENALELLNTTIKTHSCPDMVVYSFFYQSEKGDKRKAVSLFDDSTYFDKDNMTDVYKTFFTSTGLNNVWTKAVKTSVLSSIKLDVDNYSKLRCSEDRLHSMHMVDACESVVYTNEPLYIYRLFEGSVTRQFDVKSIDKFNVSSLYESEKVFLYKWGLKSLEEKLDAQYVGQMLYVLDLFYFKVSKKDRDLVLGYNWYSFLNQGIIEKIDTNSCLNSTQKQLCKWIENKDYKSLKKHFFRKKLRKTLKKLKG